MRRAYSVPLFVLVATLVAVPTVAQVAGPPNLAGTWVISASGQLPNENVPCEFEGTGNVTQDGGQVGGPVTLTLVSGPEACPAEMMADLTGTIEGSSFFGLLDGGDLFGLAQFDGTIGNDGQSLMGTFSVIPRETPALEMQFEGTTGTWTSRFATVLQIPTLSAAALALLALILIVASLYVMRRRSTA